MKLLNTIRSWRNGFKLWLCIPIFCFFAEVMGVSRKLFMYEASLLFREDEFIASFIALILYWIFWGHKKDV